jgi:hypothetical protein
MKKSETNENKNPHVPSIEEVNEDITIILKILDQLDISRLDLNTNITKLSKEVTSKLENISKKYEPLIDSLVEKNNEQKK